MTPAQKKAAARAAAKKAAATRAAKAAAAQAAAQAAAPAAGGPDPRHDPVGFYGSVDAALHAVHTGAYAADVAAAEAADG